MQAPTLIQPTQRVQVMAEEIQDTPDSPPLHSPVSSADEVHLILAPQVSNVNPSPAVTTSPQQQFQQVGPAVPLQSTRQPRPLSMMRLCTGP